MKQFIDRIKVESFYIPTEDYMLGGLRVVSDNKENREFNTTYNLKDSVGWLTKDTNKADYTFNFKNKSKEDRDYKEEISVYFPKDNLNKIIESVSFSYAVNKMLLEICFNIESNIMLFLKKNVKITPFRTASTTNKELVSMAYSLAPSPFNIVGGRAINKMLAVESNLNTNSNIFSSKSLYYDELLVIPENKVILISHINKPNFLVKLLEYNSTHSFVSSLPIYIDVQEEDKGYVLTLSTYYDLVMSKTNDNEILGDIKVANV